MSVSAPIKGTKPSPAAAAFHPPGGGGGFWNPTSYGAAGPYAGQGFMPYAQMTPPQAKVDLDYVDMTVWPR
jgi:hypothetical protein